MAAYLEADLPGGRRRTPLDGRRIAIGRLDGNDLSFSDDSTVSKLHAVLVRTGAAWVLEDVGSRNGTRLNGELMLGPRALSDGDEILVGRTKLVYRADEGDDVALTRTLAPRTGPGLTRREKDVLVELCRPALSGALIAEPAAVREIAAALFVSEDAVKQHLIRLYDKFDIDTRVGKNRRARLAHEALALGVVSQGDVRQLG